MTFKRLLEIGSRTARVHLDAVTEQVGIDVAGKVSEIIDELMRRGYIINYFDSQKAKPKVARLERHKTKHGKRKLIPLNESELRDSILEGHKEGRPSREIYDELREQGYDFEKQAYIAHWKYIRNGTYHRHGLI